MQGLKSQAVGEWQPCGDCFYTKELLFDMRWNALDLTGKRVCCAPFGGPIAVVRDEREMVVVTGDTVQPVIRIYTAAGDLLGTAMWDTSSRLISWGWTPSLQLVCVESGGMVVVRALTGEKIKEVSFGAAVAGQGVVHAHLDGSVVIVITSSGEIWVMPDVDSPRPMRLPSPPVAADVLATCCLAVQQPQQTVSGMLQVLIAAGSGSVMYSVDMEEAQEKPLSLHPPSPITSLRQSPCGGFIALFTADGRLVVMTSDLSRKLSEFETHADATPDAVEWCGSDAVVVQWSEVLLVLGPHAGDHVSWAAEGKVALASEVDGVRVVGSTRQDIIRKVPQPLSQVFSLGSTAPGATLWEARCLLDSGSARCDKLLRELGESLPAAVQTCVEAAGADFNISRQKALLQSAAYGRAFTGPSFKPHLMAETAHTLRILNAIRDPDIGLPLTAPQLHALGIRALLARLVLYRHWQLAFKIADSLTWAPKSMYEGAMPTRSPLSPSTFTSHGLIPQPPTDAIAATNRAALPMPSSMQMATLSVTAGALPGRSAATALKEAVLSAWACARISSASKGDGLSISNAELKSQLMAKLKTCPGIAYAPLAAHAQEVGRRRLALQLLDEETSCALQVPLLLSLAEGAGRDKVTGRPIAFAGEGGPGPEVEDALGRALKRAIESGDTDLVLHVLFSVYKQQPVQDFWAFLNTRALAKNLFVKYCKEREPELLETLLTTHNLSTDLGELKMSSAISSWCKARQDNISSSEAGLVALQTGLLAASAKFNTAREHAWMGKAATDLATLRREQARLERETGQNVFVGCTLEATLQQLIRYGHHKQAAALRKQFSVPDKQWWWAKIRALSAARSWDGLDAFAAEKKSPIGYEPFLEVAKKFGAPREVQARIISRLPDSAAKAEAYSSLEYTREAAELAARLKDSDLLRRITSAVQSAAGPAGLASITQIKDRFLSGTAASLSGQGGR